MPPKKNQKQQQGVQLNFDTESLMRQLLGGGLNRGGGGARGGGGRGGGARGRGGGGMEEALAALLAGMGGLGVGGRGGLGGTPVPTNRNSGGSFFDAHRSDEIPKDEVIVHAPKSVCGCKSSSRFGSCPYHKVPFADCHSFPRFKELPNYHEPFGRYMRQESGMLLPKRPWFFMGELLDDAIPFLRSRCPLATRHGDRQVCIFFYPDDTPERHYLDAKQPKMKKGATLVLSSPMWKQFMDGQVGIREEAKDYYVFSAPLKVVTRYGRLLLHNADAAHAVVGKPEEAVCVVCARTATEAAAASSCVDDKKDAKEKKKDEEASAPKPLNRCGKCKLALYCSSECQKKDWDSYHKQICGDSKAILTLASAHRIRASHQYTVENYTAPTTAEERFNLLAFPSSQQASAGGAAAEATPTTSTKRAVATDLITRGELLNGKLEACTYGESPFEGKKSDSDLDDDYDDYSDDYSDEEDYDYDEEIEAYEEDDCESERTDYSQD